MVDQYSPNAKSGPTNEVYLKRCDRVLPEPVPKTRFLSRTLLTRSLHPMAVKLRKQRWSKTAKRRIYSANEPHILGIYKELSVL